MPEDGWQSAADVLVRRRQHELEDHQDRVVRWLMQRGFPQRMVWTASDRLNPLTRREALGFMTPAFGRGPVHPTFAPC